MAHNSRGSSAANKALKELKRHRPGNCLIDPFFFEDATINGRCLREHPRDNYLLLKWGGEVLPIQGQRLTAHFRRILLAWDELGREAVPDKAFWVNMAVGETRKGNVCLRVARASEVSLSTLITEYVRVWDIDVHGTVTSLAVLEEDDYADPMHLLMVQNDANIAGVGGFDALCSLPSPHAEKQ